MRVNVALVGAGMFGGEIHAKTYAQLQLTGISPHLGRIGFGRWARDFADIEFRLVAIATRTEASAKSAAQNFQQSTGSEPKPFWGEQSWRDVLRQVPDIDVVAVATPDDLHTPVILDALAAGTHVITEKPLCLQVEEADQIIELAKRNRRVVSVDMHKRYDPDHMRIRDELLTRIGEPLYGMAYLEEPIDVSTKTFKWVERSDPFSYVGSHWVDLVYHYFHSKPVSLTAVGQRKKLVSQGIDAYDAVQVRVDYENGASISYHNNWITPGDFEGPVNQGHELVGTVGKIESDQQYRGLRWWSAGKGSRTANTHFTRELRTEQGGPAITGYGVDSLVAAMAVITRVKLDRATPEGVAPLHPNLDEARVTVAILHAARIVRDLNYGHMQSGRGATASARFSKEGIWILDPNMFATDPGKVSRQIYSKGL